LRSRPVSAGQPINLEYARPFYQYGHGVWRQGNRVVMLRNAELPFPAVTNATHPPLSSGSGESCGGTIPRST